MSHLSSRQGLSKNDQFSKGFEDNMSSRRKPQVTRKAEADNSGDESDVPNGVNDASEEEEDIPEGTVVVQPEEVTEKGTFSGPEFPKEKKKKPAPPLDTSIKKEFGRVTCTICAEQININNKGAARKHPDLRVLICKSCYKYITSGPISKDEDGLDEQCRWCSEGGKLYGCDFCHNTFCKKCIQRNLGRSELNNVTDEDKQWKCYVCNPKPLASLRSECNKVMEYMKVMEEKAKQMKEDSKKKDTSASSANKSNSKPIDNKKLNVQTKGLFHKKDTSKTESESSKTNGDVKPAVQPKVTPTPQIRIAPKPNTIVIDPSTGHSKHFQYAYPKHVPTVAYGTTKALLSNGSQLTKPVVIMGATAGNSVPVKMSNTGSPSSVFSFSKVRPGNIHSVLNRLIANTCKLEMTLKSIRSNVNFASSQGQVLPEEISERDMTPGQKYSRKTAVDCVKGGLDIFIQELQMTTGLPISAMSIPANQASAPEGPLLKSAILGSSVDTPVKFDGPGGRNSPTVTSTPKRKDDDDDVIVIGSPSPKKTVISLEDTTKKENKTNDSSGGSDSVMEVDSVIENDTKVDTNDKSEQEKDASEKDTTEKEETETKETEEMAANEEAELEILQEAENVLSEDDDDNDSSDIEKNKHKKKQEGKRRNSSNNDEEDMDTSEKNRKHRSKGKEDEDDKNKSSRSSQSRKEEEDKREDKRKKEKSKDEEEDDDDRSSSRSSRSKNDEDDKSGKRTTRKKDEKTKEEDKDDEEDDRNKSSRSSRSKKEEDDKSGKRAAKKKEEDEDENENDDNRSRSSRSSRSKKDEDDKSGKRTPRKKDEKTKDDKKEEDEDDRSGSSRSSRSKKEEDDKSEKRTPRKKDEKNKEEDEKYERKSTRSSKHDRSSRSKSQDDDEEKDNKEDDKEDEKSKRSSKHDRSSRRKSQNDEEEKDEEEDDKEDEKSKGKSSHDRSSRSKSKIEDEEKDDNKDKKKSRISSQDRSSSRSKNNDDDDDSNDEKSKTNNSKEGKKENKSKKSDTKGGNSKKSEEKDSSKNEKLTLKISLKKIDEADMNENNDSDSDEDDSDSESDSSTEDDDKDEDYGKKKRIAKSPSKKGKKSSSTKSTRSLRKRTGDESSDFNSELEDELEKLEKTPVKKKKKSKDVDSESDSRSTRRRSHRNNDSKTSKSDKSKKEEEKSKKEKKGSKKDKDAGLDDSTDDDDNKDDDVDEEADSDTEVDEALKKIITKGEEDNEDSKLELLREAEEMDDIDDDEEEDNDSSDSEVIITPRKTRQAKSAAAKKGKSKKKDDSEDDDDDDDDEEDDRSKRKRKRDKLLDAKLSGSDSDFDVPKKRRASKKRKASSESEESEEESDDSDSSKEFVKLGKRKKVNRNRKKPAGTGRSRKRRRIKQASSSSDGEEISDPSDDDGDQDKNDDDDSDGDGKSPKKGRKKIRKIKGEKKLTDSTKQAQKAEEERRKRVTEKQEKYNNIVQEVDESSPTKCPITKQLVFEFDEETKKPLLELDKGLVVKLKPHQVEAVEFIWNCTMESLERAKKEEGGGCILAHCMGLGKTLTTISFIHTVMANKKKTKMRCGMVVCPLNTVLNWEHEFEMWQEYTTKQITVYELASVKQNADRVSVLREWQEEGGMMIIGYEMFRNLTQGRNCKSKKMKQAFFETLVNPGPDFVVCDEGHVLKNDQSALSKAMNQIRTKRRIVLTGTPLQNNLIEYHCMVSFVKPSLLGTNKEFRNQFVNPIVNGQHSDSTSRDVKVMQRRAHVLHEKLNGCVQRKDYSALTKFLLPKHEYVISVRLSKIQMDLYEKYLSLAGFGSDSAPPMGRGAKLFSDYQALMRIWTHPWVLKMDSDRQERKRMFEEEDDFIDDDFGSSSGSGEASSSGSSSSSDDDDVKMSEDSDNSNGKRKTRTSKNGKEESGEKKDEIVKKWKTRTRGDGPMQEVEEENPMLTTDWWGEYVKPEDKEKVELGSKIELLFDILAMCEEIGDKVLVFSQSLLSLDLIEEFLEIVDKKHQEDTADKDKEKEKEKAEQDSKKNKSNRITDSDDEKEKDKPEDITQEVFGKHWTRGEDYFRMDGSTNATTRKNLAESFNDPENYRARLFLISTKAGGLGINLCGANRVIIFDASWNPSHDVQSIFRVYRFGQLKPVYVYRFLAQGTMEEKIYERQVTKQSLSQRVVDEHQIERHFSANDLQELYTFRPDRLDDPNRVEKTPMLPKDTLLAELMKSKKHLIQNFHEHDSLLENQVDQVLSEEERKAAWEEFENEKKGINQIRQNMMANFNPGNFGGMPRMNYPMMNYPMNMAMGGYMPSINTTLNPHNLLQLVQEMKQRYPNLPQEQLTAQVQSVIRQMITQQITQQQSIQKQQMEEKELQHQRQLHQIQAQIRQQQQQLHRTQASGSGMPGINPSLYGMTRPGQQRSTNQPGPSGSSNSASSALQNILSKRN